MRVATLSLAAFVATYAWADTASITTPIREQLRGQPDTFNTDRCGGLMMLFGASRGGDLTPKETLALRAFIMSSMHRSQRDQSAVLGEMEALAMAYANADGTEEQVGVLARDAQYCALLAGSLGL